MRARSRLRGDAGSIVVETAIAAPLVMFLLMGLFDFASLELQQSELTSATRDGARVGIVHFDQANLGTYTGGSCPAASGTTSTSFNLICTAVLKRLTGLNVSSISVQCLDSTLAPKGGTGACSTSTVTHGQDFLQVTVSFVYRPATVVGQTLVGTSRTYTATTQMVIP